MPDSLVGEIQRRIGELAGDPLVDFVFPSQVAAESHERALCLTGSAGAVESSRFLGWDRFKERLFSPSQALRPATRMARTIWAARVLARQKDAPFLEVLTGPGEPSPAFLSYIASIPPRLASAIHAIRSLAVTERPEGEAALVCADLEALHLDYCAFLDECSLFEPDWRRSAVPEEAARRRILFAPELIEDFDEYRESIASMKCVELVRLALLTADISAPRAAPVSFPNAREEIRWVFGRISRLLDAGVRPEEIAITSTQLDKAAPLILRTAHEWAVPCTVRSGAKLSATAFGRFLAAVKTCHARDFDFPSMRDLLLDKAIPWKNRELVRDLVRFGIQYHIHSNYGHGRDRVDIWKETFRTCAPHSHLEGFQIALTRGIRELAASGSFAQLRERLMKFRKGFFLPTDPDQAEERAIERVVTELGALVDTETMLGSAGVVPDPFGLFLSHLETEPYVPQSSDRSVPVYAYRVSALLAVRHHFVLGCSEESTKVGFSGWGFLPEALKEKLGRVDTDASGAFMAAYSGDPGGSVCFAVEDFSGWSAPRADGQPPLPPADLDELRGADPVLGETRAWNAGSGLPVRLCAWQIRAMLGDGPAGTIPGPPPLLSRSGADYSRGLAGASCLKDILKKRQTQDGLLRLSASAVKEYATCPFSWLVKRALRLENEPSGMGFFDDRLAGEMAHALIRELYAEIAVDGPYDPSKAAVYKTAIPRLARKVLADFSTRQGPFLEPMFEAYLPLLADRVARLVDAETDFAGWIPGTFETEGRREYLGFRVLLEGRADRIASHGNELAIVDYKKKTVPGKSDLALRRADSSGGATPDGDGADEADTCANPGGGSDPDGGGDGAQDAGAAGILGDCQIAAYIRLFEESTRRVERAAFYSIENAEWLRVIGEGGLKSRDAYEEELRAFDGQLSRIADSIRTGDFRIASQAAPPQNGLNERTCENCRWRAVCRSRFATE